MEDGALSLTQKFSDSDFEEFLGVLHKKIYREGIEGLMFAVLEDAVACFQKYATARNRKGQRLFCEAEEWILDDDTDWPFSFVNICEATGFSPDYLREGLLRWKQKRSAAERGKRIYSFPDCKSLNQSRGRFA